MTNSNPPPKPLGVMTPETAAAALRPLRRMTPEETFAQAKADQHRPPPHYIGKKSQG